MKQMRIASPILLVVGSLLTVFGCSNRAPDNLGNGLQSLVFALVEKDKSVQNCVLSVEKGDGSFSWAGAAGIANREGRVPMTKDTPIYIASITKMYTAAAIMKLYEAAALSLDDPMSKYLSPDLIKGIHVYNGKDYSNEITVKQLLAHTSGIANYYEEKGKDGKCAFDILLADPNSSWTIDAAIVRTRDELQPHFAPGTGAFYSDTNFLLLGKIIENVAQKPLQTVYEDYILRPCGCTHTWLVNLSRPQVASGATADIFCNGTAITKMRLNGQTGLMEASSLQ
jgi:D-alanyl-D-alanine carboxypeptidase